MPTLSNPSSREAQPTPFHSSYEPTNPVAQVRSLGFPRSLSNTVKPSTEMSASSSEPTVATAQRRPPPMLSRPSPKKRPKGRLFISAVLIAVMTSIGSVVWTEFFKYSAYGNLRGRVRTISSPWNASIQTIHVTEGQKVQKGDLLFSLRNPDLNLRIANTESQILVAKSSIDSKMAELQERRQDFAIDKLRAEIDYHQIISQLHSERAKASELQVARHSIEQLGDQGFVSKVEASQSTIATEGQKQRVAALEETATRYKEGLDQLRFNVDLQQIIKAEQSKLAALEAELKNLKTLADDGEVRAIEDGTILKIHEWAGELVSTSSAIIDILDAESLEAILLVKQSQAHKFSAGQILKLNIPPNRENIDFRIVRLEDQTQSAPPNISRFYRHAEQLVGVVCEPTIQELRTPQVMSPIWLGSEVRLPYTISDFLPSF